MSKVLPILFNTDMVRAILDGRKTVTRRAVKYKYNNTEIKVRTDKSGTHLIEIQKDIEGETHGKYPDGRTWHKLLPYIIKEPPCRKGDILYVRETFRPLSDHPAAGFDYAADWSPQYFENSREPNACNKGKWMPSIHMPKKAARIWLKVTDVRVERLQDITNEQILNEGISKKTVLRYMRQSPEPTEEWERAAHIIPYSELWNSTVKKSDIGLYDWGSNPWVWVIAFEQCEKPEGN